MRKAAGPKGRAKAVRTARQQRRAMSPPELALWSVLRTRPRGIKFRRQHPIGEELALDFYCGDARLAIEVDGEAHNRGDRPARDVARDAFLARYGIETLRLPATEVMRELDAVVTHVLTTVRARLPLHHSPKGASGPPPRDELGED
jgi:very-short-patch-repair endonuclease